MSKKLMRRRVITRARIEIDFEIRTSDLRSLAKDLEEQGVEAVLQLYSPERRMDRLVVETVREDWNDDENSQEVRPTDDGAIRS